MKIGIFCSANQQIDTDFFLSTRQLGQWIAQQGYTIVYGGVNQGLMECVAQAAKEYGGKTVGVVPDIVEKSGRTSSYNDVVIPCRNLSERKQLMLDESDVFIALPGGVGTLDEVLTVAASYTIGYHHKRVVLYNIKGFWDSLIALLDDLQAKGMVRGCWRDYIMVANSFEELTRLVASDCSQA
ncbi:MAG: TIGR00730 family Rossman fold protein [Prevotella sp.]|nr:TIGR00730 family Rossman fold protein [Prevotella sp.]MBQ9203635.1 TIGR00730 family Rossman fold protein [Prevotella sp.]